MIVHLFARGRELAGTDRLDIDLPAGATVAALRAGICEHTPALAELLAVSRIAVNHEFASDDAVLTASDELAVIPPVSGG